LIQDAQIRLDQYLKWQGVVRSGGEAKYLIQTGQVRVNGAVETRRTKKLRSGDVVQIGDREFTVHFGADGLLER